MPLSTPGLCKTYAVLANAGLVGLWLWLFRPVYPYLGVIFTRQEFRTNQIVLLAVTAIVISRVRGGDFQPRLAALPQLSLPALLLAVGSALGFVLAERYVDINTLSATLFGLGSYGMLGLWLRPQYWRRGLPAALLLVGALPFGEHMQTFIGYPVRILTAGIVQAGLAALGVPSVGVDTILVFENGLSQVDLPCSGVKSLWTGGLFLLAATWVERKRITPRWLLLALAFAGLLLLANLARVAVLVSVGMALGWTLLAEMLHVPLGVLGFVGACLAGLVLLRRLPGYAIPAEARPVERPAWLAPALGAATLILALAYTPRPQSAASAAADPVDRWSFPAGLRVEPWAFTQEEAEWIASDGAEDSWRWRFEWRGVKGSLLMLSSHTWRTQHRPERCFEVYGLATEDSQAFLAQPDFPLRLVELSQGGAGGPRYHAAYWFQSANRTTEDYGARIWADLRLQPERWVLVTVLFDQAQQPRDPDLVDFYQALHQAVQANLQGE